MSEEAKPAEEAAAPPDENRIIAERRAKLAALRAEGPAYPNDFFRTHMALGLDEEYGETPNEELEPKQVYVTVAGRLMFKRVMGKASFGVLQDGSGRIQIYVTDDHSGAAGHAAFKHWDVGDVLGVKGFLFRTRKGELTVRAHELRLLVKSLRPLPEKFHGLADQETRYRQRYVDLLVNERSRWVFAVRSRVIQSIRQTMGSTSYIEVETPMLQPIPGGATARPFRTHHHALDMDMYLRIAPELYLKRLVVGGIDKVYEINRSFRNEGISTRHNPEFTMMEVYCAYTNHTYMMSLMETLIRNAAQAAIGATKVSYQGRDIDLGKPFSKMTMTQAIQRFAPEHWSPSQLRDRGFLASRLAELGVEFGDAQGWGALQTMLFEAIAEKRLIEPTFVLDFPAEVSPLARSKDSDPETSERFELYIDGKEIANGFSELNDPEDQAERFREQARRKDAGDQEAMFYDADYIRAMEYGLPPTSGAGLGIDRVVMLLTDSPSIRDVILFPHMRPESD
ncbi:MAG: lysine--tRNA ligase [Burkholderiales bacterium]